MLKSRGSCMSGESGLPEQRSGQAERPVRKSSQRRALSSGFLLFPRAQRQARHGDRGVL